MAKQLLITSATAEGPAAIPTFAFIRRCWVPLLLAGVLAGLTMFGVNGSSAAAVRSSLGGVIGEDPHLLAGSPIGVRADEWAINTPLTIMQVRTGMPRIQPLLGNGTDMSLSYDVPIADQWAFLRPQHWGFLALPLAQGFAFHWWFPAVMLVLALWLLTSTLLPGRNLLGLLIGLAAVFSPFFQWWYLAGSFLPEALALFSCVLFIQILHTTSRWRMAAYLVLLTWVLASFALLLYPPFQIPCALVAAAFCLGYLIFTTKVVGWRSWLPRIGSVISCGVISAACVVLFLLDHRGAVEAITSSAYPGNRTVSTGGYSVSRLLSGFLDRRLTVVDAAKSIDLNQSEASSPLLTGLFAVPVLAWTLISARHRGEYLNPVLLLLTGVLGLFLVDLFVPHLDLIANLTLLDRVPANRLLLGMGMLSDVLLIVTAWHVSRSPALPRLVVVGAGVAPFIVLSGLALHLHVDHALFVGSLWVAGVLAASIAVAVSLFAAKLSEMGAAVLLLVSLLIAGAVNPISIGVSTTDELPIVATVAQINRAEPGGWIAQIDRVAMGALPEQSIHIYSAVYNYPQTKLWRELDPTGAQFEYYNRYGYANFVVQRGPTRFLSHSLDGFTIAIDGCAPFIQAHVKHILTLRPLDADCVRLRQTQTGLADVFYIYDVVDPAH